ncbi:MULTISPECIES: STAS domain-containing protein [unclassified Streptosporangium]|uniref:STAS domain-containing protein n=1 Tax=unclassified Streptosporangium TaxID=2632669 RepID=UPI002E29E00D|nr:MULTISPECIES: STAS domain-containing protein [unclassified Streptosporangium]
MPGDRAAPQVQSWRVGPVRVLRLIGELDAVTVPEVAVTLDEALLTFEDLLLVVDLTQVTFIASAGVGALVRMRQDVQRRHGRLIVVLAPQGRARRLFELTRMVDHFEVRLTLPEAVSALRGQEPRPFLPEQIRPSPEPTPPPTPIPGGPADR